jgi:hypothetical protein
VALTAHGCVGDRFWTQSGSERPCEVKTKNKQKTKKKRSGGITLMRPARRCERLAARTPGAWSQYDTVPSARQTEISVAGVADAVEQLESTASRPTQNPRLS